MEIKNKQEIVRLTAERVELRQLQIAVNDDGKEYPVSEPDMSLYLNVGYDREQLQKDHPDIYAGITAISHENGGWGDTPTLEPTPPAEHPISSN